MPSNTLKKALQGDEYSLVLMTEIIGTNQIELEDLNYLRNSRISNDYKDYLYACCLYWGAIPKKDHVDTKHILKFLAAKDNGFACNLLGGLYYYLGGDQSEKNVTKSKKYIQKAFELNNPLGILNQFQFKNDLQTVLTYAPQIFHRLSPYYQKELMGFIDSLYSKSKSPEEYYQFARLFEKMNMLPQMYGAFHKAIETSETKWKYQRKLVKTLEKHANSNSWSLFRTEFDYSFLKSRLTSLKKELVGLDKIVASLSVSKEKELTTAKGKIALIGLELKNCWYILQEKGSHFKPNQYQAIHEMFNSVTTLLNVLSPTNDSMSKESSIAVNIK
ncbi:hypothetical protein EAS68_05290 [Legionella jordanis]|uniref:hypothetical protein n=1 Tax=Legionella jordanis TaxID=456 RepID=UPI000EFEDC2C|nr:hypothetical protein [Legionella jordanis]RMX21120.1 hypothetical protein EAS68_05290 [Legionella jordanis]HAT8713544.1 hypothetical protein [Legionella jordanis]